MQAAVKFCGLTRPLDAAYAAELGASFVGVIFAESPRRLEVPEARAVFAAAGAGPRAVAVFGPADPGAVLERARSAGARVIQLHGPPPAADPGPLRSAFAGDIWSVVRVGNAEDPLDSSLFDIADGIVLDTSDALRLGGTGRAFDWSAAAERLRSLPRPRKLVLAGGLRPSNVGDAIRLLQPDVVDVSSGVESSPGIKNHALMRAFIEAVAEADHR